MHYNEGIIEIYDNVAQKWGPVCGLDIGWKEADVICKQLGYHRGFDTYYSDGDDEYGSYYNAYKAYVYVGLSCYTGDETHIDDCFYEHRSGSSEYCGYMEREFGAVKCDVGDEDGEYQVLSFTCYM